VIAAASTDEKLALCRTHGADEVINYTTDSLRDRLKAITHGLGPDVICDPVGGDLAEPAFRSIAWGGRYLVIGFAGGAIPSLPLNLPLLKGASVVGVFWGAFTDRDPAANQRNNEELLDLYTQGKIRPHVSEQYPLADAGRAISALAERRALGKLVVTID
jgi:NADPH2:quinone reductase